jgi:hypothetical protein
MGLFYENVEYEELNSIFFKYIQYENIKTLTALRAIQPIKD